MNLFASDSEKSYKDIFDLDENKSRRKKRKKKILHSSSDSNNIKYNKGKDEGGIEAEYNLFNTSSSDNNNNNNNINSCKATNKQKKQDEKPFCLFSSNTHSDNNINNKSIEKNEYCLFSNNSESENCCDNKKKNESHIKENKMYSLFSSNSEYDENINNKKNNLSNNIFNLQNNNIAHSKDEQEKKNKKDSFLKWTPHNNIKRSYNKRNYNKRTCNDNNSLYKNYENYENYENYKNIYNDSRKSKVENFIKRNYKHKDMKNKVNNLFKQDEKGEYRLVNFEKLKKRAYRKLNFLSIVDVAKSLSDVSEENKTNKKINNKNNKNNKKSDDIYDNTYDDTYDDTYNNIYDDICDDKKDDIYYRNNQDIHNNNQYEKDILNNSICSSDSFYKSNESFFLYDKDEDSTNLDSIENNKYNNQTLDIYNYYYLNNHDERNKDNKYLEKIVCNSTITNCDDLYNYLFQINNSIDKDKQSENEHNDEERNMDSNNINDEDNINADICEFEKKKETHQTNGANQTNGADQTNTTNHTLDGKDNLFIKKKKKIRTRKRRKRKKKDFLLKRNIILYRNFKNINNEISRQNNKKGLRFKEMIGDFIRVLNKNVLKINEQNEKKQQQKESQYYENNINNNKSNTNSYNMCDNNTNFNLFEDDTSDVESFINFECYTNSCDMMEKATCDCEFCIQHNKILNKNELYLILFKYMEDNKTDGTTIIKPYFLNIYVFTCFINFFIHYKNITICKVDDIDDTNNNCDDKSLDDHVNNMNNTCKDEKEINYNKFQVKKKKKFHFYKYSHSLYTKYQINKIVYFIPKRIVLTTVGICIYGVNFLNKENEEDELIKEREKEKDECVAIINFLKWKKVRKNFYEILKLKKKRKENLMIYKKCFFFINAIDEYCNMYNIPIDDTYSYNTQKNKKNKKNLHNRIDTHFNLYNNKTNTYDNSFEYYNQAEMQKIQRIQKVEEIQYIQDILNSNLQVNNIQFLFFDPIYVSSKKYVHFYPSHLIMLF
ncbi:hypothetical protein PGSY75_1204100 [Plasmodium gaboni]|uniref:Uncharacterized protein n=1 Tax=Plasmodium gaboni TaxID=647221 RepID=A0A151LG74_9APIC|nr:hypothetical protein PGSY75_1204100 [Plasmodium gaboni]KYN97859.1 hypothetical protein PGSY75_1204100 [Plasmodium gaboni]